MNNHEALFQRFCSLLGEERTQHERFLSASLPLSIAVIPKGIPEAVDQRYYWSRPAKDEWWLGLGCTWLKHIEDEQHLKCGAQYSDEVFGHCHSIDPEECNTPLRLAVWSEVESTDLILPTVQISSRQGVMVVTVTIDLTMPTEWQSLLHKGLEEMARIEEPISGPLVLSHRQQKPGAATWLDIADRAIETIRCGEVEKLVLARKVGYITSRDLSAKRLVKSLEYYHPHCTVYAADRREGCWAGASPEVLFDCRNDRFLCEAVAGTVRRDPDESVDRKLGEWLLRDPKSRREHEVVARWLSDRLKPYSQSEQSDIRLLHLRGLQHLYMSFAGTLNSGVHPLEIAQLLHPSPAVSGMPQMASMDWLKQHELLDRKAYSGLTGWIDAAGDCALNVILRCACIVGDRVDLYAGAGLVADSDSVAEWEETELKLNSMIEALQDA